MGNACFMAEQVKRIIRVFPRRTRATPCDGLVVVGRGPDLFDVALAVLYCESRRPPPFECGLREGVDYFVERAEE